MLYIEYKRPPKAPAPEAPPIIREPVVYRGTRIGRNEPCPCGSGIKFKRCHLPATRLTDEVHES